MRRFWLSRNITANTSCGPRTQLQLQVLAHSTRALEDGSFRQLLCQRAARQFKHGDDHGALGGSQPLDLFECIVAGVQQAADAAKTIQEFLGQLEHVFAGDTGAQQQGQQLAVGEGAGGRVPGVFREGRESLGQCLSPAIDRPFMGFPP